MNNQTKNWLRSALIVIIGLIVFAVYLINLIIKQKQGQKINNTESDFQLLETSYHSKIEKANVEYEFFDTEVCIKEYLSTLKEIKRNMYLDETRQLSK